MADEDDLIPKAWLVERVDPAKAEADGHVDGTHGSASGGIAAKR
jgi:hypothetical protein